MNLLATVSENSHGIQWLFHDSTVLCVANDTTFLVTHETQYFVSLLSMSISSRPSMSTKTRFIG